MRALSIPPAAEPQTHLPSPALSFLSVASALYEAKNVSKRIIKQSYACIYSLKIHQHDFPSGSWH